MQNLLKSFLNRLDIVVSRGACNRGGDFIDLAALIQILVVYAEVGCYKSIPKICCFIIWTGRHSAVVQRLVTSKVGNQKGKD